MNTTLQRLAACYESPRAGDREHAYGVHVETLDPGRFVKIDRVETRK